MLLRMFMVLLFILQAPVPVPAPAKAKVELKSEVALSIRNLELKQTQRLLQLKQIEEQYKQIQTEYQADGTKLSGLLQSALKDSGLDEKKYAVNGDTLEVTELPASAKKDK